MFDDDDDRGVKIFLLIVIILTVVFFCTIFLYLDVLPQVKKWMFPPDAVPSAFDMEMQARETQRKATEETRKQEVQRYKTLKEAINKEISSQVAQGLFMATYNVPDDLKERIKNEYSRRGFRMSQETRFAPMTFRWGKNRWGVMWRGIIRAFLKFRDIKFKYLRPNGTFEKISAKKWANILRGGGGDYETV